MDALKGDSPARTGSFMPPATTRRFPERPLTSKDARIVPPFVPSEPAAISEPQAFEAEPAAPEPEAAAEAQPPRAEDIKPQPDEATEGESFESEVIEIDLGWEETLVEEEGIVEPAFAVDAEAVLRELSEQAAELSQHPEFPMEALGVLEETGHVVDTETEAPAESVASPAVPLAERLEQLSQRLRTEQADDIVRQLAAGDRLDALLAGLLAGYLAGKSEQ